MTQFETDRENGHERTELDDRDVRALTEYLTVLEDTGRVRGADGLYLVVSQSGSEYLVDAEHGACECADARHRDVECKHQRRVAFATGEREIPAWVDRDAVDDQLGKHVSAEPRQAVTDGGRLTRERTDRQRVPVSGGVLVFEDDPDELGKRLVGFEDVTSLADLRTALAARGLGVGAINHKPVLDDSLEGDR